MSIHRSLAIALLGLTAVQGQEPAPEQPPQLAPPGVPVPGVVPPPAAGARNNAAEPARQPGVPLGETKITADINEPKLSGSALSGLYRKYTGRRVIVSQEAMAAEFAFVQEATPEDPLTFAEAAELLRTAAKLSGFVFVSDEKNPNLEILTLSSAQVNPKLLGFDVLNENSPLPDNDSVITYVMPLDYIKPAEAVNVFTQIIGQFGAYGSIAPVPNASAIVITENTSLIRKLIELKKEIDKPSSEISTRFVKVQYADVTEIATTLTELLTAQQTAQTTAGIQRAGAAPAAQPVPGALPQGDGGAGGSSSGESTPVQILPDPRTNRIFAMGRPVDLLFVEGLVREFDIETSEKNFLRRKLRFLSVSEFLPIAGDALTRAFSGTGEGGAQGGGSNAQGGGGGNRSQTAGNRQGGGGGGGGRNSGGSSGANFGGSSGSSGFGGSSGGGGGGGGAGNALSSPDVNSAPESVLVGRTLLVADNITNSIVVQGPPSGLEIIERLLDQIDVKPDQVMISTVIGQLTLNDNISMGLDYLKVGGKFVGRGGGGLGPILPISPGGSVDPFNPGTLGANAGLQLYGRVGDNINIYLDALKEKTDFTVLSRPSIFTANNQKGTISSGERIAIPTSSNSFNNGGASTNIEYQDVVLKLEVIPRINSDNEITMEIALLSDEVTGTQTIAGAGSNGAPLSLPEIATRELLTYVTVPNNQTIVLGGLIVSRNNNRKSGIPLLSDIPLVGSLFGRTTQDKDRSELMVFMQPSVVKSDRSLDAVQADMDARYRVSPKIREMADGPGVLPPADVIVPLDDKAGSRAVVAPAPGTVILPAPAPTTRKPNLRPVHRR